MPRETVEAVFFGLIAAAKADHVGGDHSGSASGEDRDHLAIQIAPRGVAVEAKVCRLRAFVSLVEIVHAQAIQGGQITDVVWREIVAGQIIKAMLWRAQRVWAQGMIPCMLNLLLSPLF